MPSWSNIKWTWTICVCSTNHIFSVYEGCCIFHSCWPLIMTVCCSLRTSRNVFVEYLANVYLSSKRLSPISLSSYMVGMNFWPYIKNTLGACLFSIHLVYSKYVFFEWINIYIKSILDVYLLFQCHQQWFWASSDNVTLFIVSTWETCVPYVEPTPFQRGATRSIDRSLQSCWLLNL